MTESTSCNSTMQTWRASRLLLLSLVSKINMDYNDTLLCLMVQTPGISERSSFAKGGENRTPRQSGSSTDQSVSEK